MPKVWFLFPLIFLFEVSFATERGINIQAFVKKPDGTPVSLASVSVNVKVISPNNCILLDEDHAGTAISSGFFYVVVGKGTRTANDNGLSLLDVLNNRTAVTNLDTLNGTQGNCNYTPASSDARKIQVSFSDSGTPVVAQFNIRSSAYAIRADDAESVQGVAANQILQTNASVTQAKINQLVDHILAPIAAAGVGSGFTWNGTELVAYDPSNGGLLASNTVQPSSIVSLPYSKISSVPAPLTTIAGLSCASGEILKFNGTAWACATDATGAGAVSSVAGRTGVVTLTSADLSDFNSASDARADARISAASFDASKITTGTLVVPVSASLVSATTGQFTTLKVYDGTANYLTQTAPTGGFGGSGYTVRWPANVGAANQVLQISAVNSGIADLSWANPSASGLTNLNGASGASQSFAVGTSGTAPNFSTASDTHTLNIPFASGAGVTGGLISKTDYDSFAGKMSSSLTDSKIWVGNGSNQATAVSLSGDASIANTGAMTVNGLKGKTISAAPTLAGQVLRYDGTNFAPASIAMTDLRSSVTGTAAYPTACTASQTLTYNSVGDSMNCDNIAITGSQVSGNISGNAANVSGTVAIANGGTGATTQAGAANAILPSQSSNSGKYLTTDGTNVSWSSAPSGQWSTSGSNIYYNSGKVGVGTNPSSAALEAFSSSDNALMAYSSTSTNQNLFGVFLHGSGTGDYIFGVPDGQTRETHWRNNAGGWSAAKISVTKTSGSNSNGTMTIQTTGHSIPQVYLDASGNVGVGTTSPGAQLEVDTAATTTKGLVIKGMNSQTANLQEWGSNGSTYLYVDPNGNLKTTWSTSLTGFGTLVTADGGGYAAVKIVGTSRSLEYSNTGSSTTDARLYHSAANTLTLDNGSNAAANLNVLGNLGVNTGSSAATYALDVVAPGWTDATTARFTNYRAGIAVVPSLILVGVNSTSNGATGMGTSLNMQAETSSTSNRDLGNVSMLWTDGTDATRTSAMTVNLVSNAGAATEQMRVTGDGKVGIGVTSPVEKLDINGNVKLAKNSAQPYTCDATHDGVVALTSQYTTCVCNGGATSWVRTSDGSTACSW